MEDSQLSKERWVRTYSELILRSFARGQSALGYDAEHAEFIHDQLVEYFDNPQKKEMIESAYPPDYAML